MEQTIIFADEGFTQFEKQIRESGTKAILLVCGSSIRRLRINRFFEELEGRSGIRVVRFSDFQPNPQYESVVAGVEEFHRSHCDSIIAVGGGSAMDVAKCIKLFCNMDASRNYLQQEPVPNEISLTAVPTTAGTGSEATRYAVIYYKGEKQSVTDEACIPSTVLFDASVLESLPDYQKKATMMDAFCHALESFWSVNSTPESKIFSKKALQMIFAERFRYLMNDPDGGSRMLEAANLAGKAINITQTTGGHAMSYKITSLFGISHGHAAALVDRTLFPWMLEHLDRCIDGRGEAYLADTFREIADAMGCDSPKAAAEEFSRLYDELQLPVPEATEAQLLELRGSVNPVRLKNNPVELDLSSIDELYHIIFAQGTGKGEK